MAGTPDDNEARRENSPAFMQIVAVCEDMEERLSKYNTAQLDERREVAKHLLTLSSSILVLTVTLATAAWHITKTIPDIGTLRVVWIGFSASLLFSVVSLWYHIGVRSFLVHLWNEFPAINAKLNENPNLDLQPVALDVVTRMTQRVVRSDNRAVLYLRVAFVAFAASMFGLVYYAWWLFGG